MMIRQKSFVFAALLSVCGLAHADSQSAARRCVAIADRDARLACFDAAFAAPAPSVSPTSPPAVAAAPAPAVPARAPEPASFGNDGQLGAEKQEKLKLPRTMTAVVRSVGTLSGDLFRLTLDNGQVWDTRDANWAADYKPGDSVTIQHMYMGGYQLSAAKGGKTVGAKRIQ